MDEHPNPMHTIPLTTIDELIKRYDALLFDAYGVLVHRDGPLPGACELLARLRRLGKPFYLVTNSAARLPEHAAQRYRCFGLAIEPEQIISSGSLLKPILPAMGWRDPAAPSWDQKIRSTLFRKRARWPFRHPRTSTCL